MDKSLFFSTRETDETITLGSASFEALHRNRLEYDRRKLLEGAIRSYRLNPLCRRIVKLYRYFALGNDLQVEVTGKPGGLLRRLVRGERVERTQRFVRQFWNHPLNRLDEQVLEWFDERTLTGELYLLFSVDASGMPLVRAIPAETITRIDTAGNDYRQETCYHTGELDDAAYRAWTGSDQYSEASGQCHMRHYVINRPVGSSWGESDLFPLLPWIARYTSWLENRANLNYWRQVFIWMVKGRYKSAAECQERQKQIEAHPPRPGSVLVGVEGETWETVSPRLDSFEAGADGLALKKLVAAGAGIPMHFLAEPESSTRTTAEAAGTPAFRNFQDYQRSFFSIIRDVLEIACALRRQVDGSLLPSPEFEIHAGDISERDNANLSLAFERSVAAAGELYDRKMIDTKEFLRIAYGFGELMYGESADQAEGLRRPLSNRSKTPNPHPSTPKTDPETGEAVEPRE